MSNNSEARTRATDRSRWIHIVVQKQHCVAPTTMYRTQLERKLRLGKEMTVTVAALISRISNEIAGFGGGVGPEVIALS